MDSISTWKGWIDMAEKLCELRKKGGGGGKYTETSLWTNPSPTSDFAAQTVTLSDSIDNYKYIAIKYKYDKYGTGTSFTDVCLVDDWKKSVEGGNTSHDIMMLGIQASNNAPFARMAFYVTSLSVKFSVFYQLSGSSYGADAIIPLEILGLNELAHGKNFDETTLWTNNAPTSSFAATTVALSDDIDNYDYIAIRYRSTTSIATENEVVYKVSNFKQLSLGNGTNHNTAGLVRQDTANSTFCRPFGYVSNTSIRFELCYRLYATSYDGTMCIPTSIVGYKFK
jgi:hypothetical protein